MSYETTYDCTYQLISDQSNADMQTLISETGSSEDQMANSKDIGKGIVIDIVCCLIVGIPLLILQFADINPFRRGYFCDDDSIRLSYKDSTVPSAVAYVIGTVLPLIAFLISEVTRYKQGRLDTTTNLKCFGFYVHPLGFALYKTIFFFGFGCLCSQLLTDIGKFSVGRLRPHFLDVCKSSYTCPSTDNHLYIVDYTCDGARDKIKDARLSFPSGHSSFSAYTMIYLALYIQFRFRWRGSPLLRPFLQLLAIILAYYTGLSRISDHKHHYSDVIGGALLGTIVAFFICFAVSDIYPIKNATDETEAAIPLKSHHRDVP